MLWYFAYGSNMQSATLRGRRCVEYARAHPARLDGWRLVVDKPSLIRDGNTFANIIPDPQAHVWGVSFEISEEDMSHIDLTEGVLIGNYARVEVRLQRADDSDAPFAAYTLTSEKRHPQTCPSHRYMRLVIEGAIEHGLPAPYIEFLRSIPCIEESPHAQAMRGAIDDFMRKR